MNPVLQFRSAALCALVGQAVQARLAMLDLPPDGDRHVDHVDVAAGGVEVLSDATGVCLVVPLDVFVVTRAAAVAAIDDVPAGALVPAAPVDLRCALRIDGTVLSLRAGRPPTGPAMTDAWCTAIAAAAGPWSLDLQPQFAAFGIVPTASARVTADAAAVAVRFGAGDNPLPALPPALDWTWCGVTVPDADAALAPCMLAGARLAGTATGGPLVPPPATGDARVAVAAARFGPPTRVTTCRSVSRDTRGSPRAVTLDELSSRAEVRLADAGRLLGVEGLSGPLDLTPHLRRLPGEHGVVLVLPSSLTLSITAPVRLLLRTSRGLRAVDLGVPPHPQIDAAGRVTNAETEHVTNCVRADGAHGLHWRFAATRPFAGDGPVVPVRPDWTTWLAGLDALDVQLVLLDGLEPGELLHFRSRDHAAHVAADRHGRARVPVVMPVAGHATEGSLVRTSRRPIAGRYVVRGVTFLDTSPQRHRGVAWLNPQPLPPVAGTGSARHPLLARGVVLPGLVSLDALPGFDDAPIALARMDDGTVLVVEADDNGVVRVAGTFEGPIGPLDSSRYRLTRA